MKELVGALSIAVAATAAVAQQTTPEHELIQLELDWCAATVKKDAALLGRILADAFTGFSSRGQLQTKADALADFKDQTTSTETCLDRDVKVRTYGNAAVVTGLGTRTGTYKGIPYKDRQIMWTDTFVRKDGRWQCVAS
jgi:ketosteroid isomerase-like protein